MLITINQMLCSLIIDTCLNKNYYKNDNIYNLYFILYDHIFNLKRQLIVLLHLFVLNLILYTIPYLFYSKFYS